MKQWPVRVIKVGGSLLEFDLLPTRLHAWLELQPPSHNVIIVGGGASVEAVRDADRRFALGEAFSHRLCLDLMGTTAQLFQGILSRSTEPTIFLTRGLANLTEKLLSATTSPLVTIFDAAEFMRNEDEQFSSGSLPQCWDVTSDSIAARIAVLVAAQELVLLKSAIIPECSRQAASELQFVDRYFERASTNLPVVRAVHLRSPSLESVMLHR